MRSGDSRAKGGPGIIPAQDHGFKSDGTPLEQRTGTLAMRIKGREKDTGRWIVVSGSLGDVTTWYMWEPEGKPDRKVPAWRASPFMVRLKSQPKDPVQSGGGDLTPGGPGGEVTPNSRPPSGEITPGGGPSFIGRGSSSGASGGGGGGGAGGGGPLRGGPGSANNYLPPRYPPNPNDLPGGTGGYGTGNPGQPGGPGDKLYMPEKQSEPTSGDGPIELEPLRDKAHEPDDRLKTIKVDRPKGGLKYPGGWKGFLGTGTEEASQEPIFAPTDGRLVASNRGDPTYATTVVDLDATDVDDKATAPLQSQLRVVKKPTGKLSLEGNKANALARSIGISQKADALALVVDGKGADAPHGRETVRDGGHLCMGGGSGCGHQIGTTEEGAPIYPTHLHTKAFFRDKGGKRCGPIDFEQDYPSATVGPIVVVGGIAYESRVPYSWPLDEGSQQSFGKWRIYAYSFFGGGGGDDEDTPTTGGGGGDDGGGGTPPGEGGGGDITPGGGPGTGGGGDGGGGGSFIVPPGGGGGGPTTDQRRKIGPAEDTPAQSSGDSWLKPDRAYGITHANLRMPGMVFRAQPAAAGAPDLAETLSWAKDDVRHADRTAPAVLRVSAWTKQAVDGSPAEYTRARGDGVEPTADGGIEFLPPERLPVDAGTLSGSVPSTHAESAPVVSVHPGVAVHFGTVDRSVGAVTGWQAQATEGGELVIYRVDASGVRTEKLRLTSSGITFAESVNMTFDSAGAGTRIGTDPSEKFGFHGAVPSAQDTGWSATGTSTRRTVDSGDALSDVIDTVGTLIQQLVAKGVIGG